MVLEPRSLLQRQNKEQPTHRQPALPAPCKETSLKHEKIFHDYSPQTYSSTGKWMQPFLQTNISV